MIDATKPSAPGSFSKLMTTPLPSSPAAGKAGQPKLQKNKAKKRKPARTAARVSAPASVAPQEAVQLTPQSTNHSTSQPVEPPVSRRVDRSVDPQLMSKVVDRPVSFYLPEIINAKIDEAVDYMEKRHRVKVDRSAVVSAILGNPTVWKPEARDQLVDKVVSQLTSRLTSRLTR